MKAKRRPSLYLQFLNNIKIPGLIYTALVTLTTAIFSMEIAERCTHTLLTVHLKIGNVYGFLIHSLFIASALIVFYAFSFLRSKRSTDFYMSLPIKRTSLYFTALAAAFTWVGIAMVAAIIAGIIPCIPVLSSLYVDFKDIIPTFSYAIVMALLGGGISALCCSMTGTTGTAVLSFVGLAYLPAMFPTSVMFRAQEFQRGEDFRDSIYGWFRSHYLIDAIFDVEDYVINVYNALLFTLFIAVLFIGLGIIFFNKRHSEVAGNGMPNKLFHFLNRGSIVLMIMWTLISVTDLLRFVAWEVIAVTYVLYIAYELVITKRLKNVIPATLWFIPTAMAGLLPSLFGYLLAM